MVRAQNAALIASGFRYSLSLNKAHSKHRALLANRLHFGVVDESDDYLPSAKAYLTRPQPSQAKCLSASSAVSRRALLALGPWGIRRPASLLGFGPTTSRHIVHDRPHRRRAQLRAIPKHLDHCVEGRVPFEPKARIPAGQRNPPTVGALASARRRPQLPFCRIRRRPYDPTAFRKSYRCERLKTRGPSTAATFKLRYCRIGALSKEQYRGAGIRIARHTIRGPLIRGSSAFSFTASRLLVPGPVTSWMAITSSPATTPRSTSRSGKTAMTLRPICTNIV